MAPDEGRPAFDIGIPSDQPPGEEETESDPAEVGKRQVADPPDVWPETTEADSAERSTEAKPVAAQEARLYSASGRDERSVTLPIKLPEPETGEGGIGPALNRFSTKAKKVARICWWKLIVWFHYLRFGLEWMILLSWRIRYHRAKRFILQNKHIQKIIAVLNQKGGSGKTALAVSLLMMMAHILKRHFTGLDANENLGNTADRAGLKRSDTILLRHFLDICETLTTFEAFTGAVAWHPETGVSVIASDDKSNISFPRYRFERGLMIAKQNSHAVVCDCGNGLRYAPVMGSVRMADNLLFVGNVNMPDSVSGTESTVGGIESTMTRYNEWFPDKVERGIIVIFGSRLRKRAQFAKQFNYPIDRVFMMPRNRIMSQGKMPPRIILYPLRVQVILMEIIVAILKTDAVEHETVRYTNTNLPRR